MVHFAIARCARLLQSLIEFIFSALKPLEHSAPLPSESRQLLAYAVKSTKIFANLLSFHENRQTVKERFPSIVTAMLDCQRSSDDELIEASKIVVNFLHEGPVAEEIMAEFSRFHSPRHL
jgi:hypothetical protein